MARPWYERARYRRRRRTAGKPPLDISRILRWADSHHRRTGEWPHVLSGPIAEAPRENWSKIDQNLYRGFRGLPGGDTLAKVLARHRAVRNPKGLPQLTLAQIRRWAVAHRKRTGDWPRQKSGPIVDAPGETWVGVDRCLAHGHRGLQGGSSLARLLADEFGKPHPADLPRFRIPQIARWADAYHRRTGRWPTASAGAVHEAPTDTWLRIDNALRAGSRGLPGGSSLAQLLASRRRVRNPAALPPLTRAQILRWIDAYHAQTGRWPAKNSGPIDGAPGETWQAIGQALDKGRRGLEKSSLARLLADERGVPHRQERKPFKERTIAVWARAHLRRTGSWPTAKSGTIPECPDTTWTAVESALTNGLRGLPGGDSIARLLCRVCGKPNLAERPRLTERRILEWADRFHQDHGYWPTAYTPPMPAPNETWRNINAALQAGTRGLRGGSSLAQLLARERGVSKWTRRNQ